MAGFVFCSFQSSKYSIISSSHLIRHAFGRGLQVKLLFARSMCLQQSEAELHLKNIHEKYEREKQSKQKKYDRYRKWSLPVVCFSGTGLVMFIGHKYGQPDIDSVTGVEFEDEYTGQTFGTFRRAWKNIRSGVRTEFEEPSRKKLLPDPLQKPYIQPKYTVLIELRDLLVHPEWSFETGWRFRKRPGIDFLLETLVNHSYETVIFTSEPGFMAMPVVESLNSKGVIMYSLFRDSTHYRNNVYTKDISRINRDHSRVIILETDKAKVVPNPENSLVIPPWDGNMADRNLYDLAMFLRAIESTHCSDVRTFLKAYSNEEDPLETFRQRQLVLQQQAESQKTTSTKGKAFSRSIFQSKR
ncbi:mitochondrial import inner membrane translocase subunit TIM50-like [Convolutriloba macropyga]|uniref:mitochondrial import inner membrane translocase subunit TIM50-like n=1 Tax=Convolutriloba macropyga TaxID=536237 RepID=UPI003F51FB84